ncbi:DUF4097 family beta strand repeat-containing protein [Nocardia sp. NPDC004151]|uniref:DUF4097 family beta strand repeat-containing protein n=1 Tax=Nocardia sp. NPDC004151 TaxID=3364304 RepID=UPI0036C13205
MTAFETPAPITVDVAVAAGNVTVTAADRTESVVDIRPANPGKKEDVRAAEQVRIDFTDGVLTVKTPTGWRAHNPFAAVGTIAVTIAVPTGSRLTGTVGLGNLFGAGGLGDCELEVSAGDITVERPQGSVTAKVAKGDIHITEAARGVLRLETSMGDLTVGIKPGSAAQLESNTKSGSVQNRLAAVDQPRDLVQVYAHTSFGNVSIGQGTAA